MISGIKRKTTAAEGTFRFFQTIDLIINHFKRKADKKKIFELITEETTLKGLLIATAAIHIYHYLGIRVEESFNLSQNTIETTKNLELREKQNLVNEIKLLLKDSFDLEIDILYRIIDMENRFIQLLIEERKIDFQNIDKKRVISEIDEKIEKEFLEIILMNHPFYFYDLIGELIGYTNEVKINILEEASAFKDLSIELEKKLEKEEKEDKFIELSTLRRLIHKIQEDFEFKSYKELQTQAMPLRMIKRRLMDYDLDRFPISISGLEAYLAANDLKKDLIKKIEIALKETIDYEQFEEEMLNFLKSKLIEYLKVNPNDFIYFLQNLNESSFNEIIYMLNKYGLYNILQLLKINDDLTEKVKKYMIRYNIDNYDIMLLNDQEKNLIFRAKKALTSIEFSIINKCLNSSDDPERSDFTTLIYQESDELRNLWKKLEEKSGISITDLRLFVQKKRVIDKVFLNDLKLNDYTQILVVLNFEELMDNLVREIFFYILSKVLRQLSRIIEAYNKIINEKALFLLALKKMYATTDSEEWIWVKFEELLINRLQKRQEELVIVFDAMKQPFLVNGFILARLTDSDLEAAMNQLKNEESPIFEEIVSLKLNPDLISPVSYCIAYDLIRRFEKYEETRKEKVVQVIEQKEQEKELQKKKLREKQEISTLNWIERRITSSLMRISSPGINPNLLYWQEKDTKIATDNIKLHSELNGDVIDLLSEYFDFVIEKIKTFAPDLKLPNSEKITIDIMQITDKVLMNRLQHSPSRMERNMMIEGERYDISKQIAEKIGKVLDKALYYKFKKKRK